MLPTLWSVFDTQKIVWVGSFRVADPDLFGSELIFCRIRPLVCPEIINIGTFLGGFFAGLCSGFKVFGNKLIFRF